MDFGIPVNLEGKPNWSELREKFYTKYTYYEAKSVNLLEKLIQEFRSICQQVIFKSNYEQQAGLTEGSTLQLTELSVQNGQEGGLQIDPEVADRFYFNTNLLKFIRKTILFNNEHTWRAHVEELQEEINTKLTEDSGHPAYLPTALFPAGVWDKKLLLHVATQGIYSLGEFRLAATEEGAEITAEEYKDALWERIKFVCEFFKTQEDRSSIKKKKGEKGAIVAGLGSNGNGFGLSGAAGGPDGGKKKMKNNVATDEAGNIIYPMLVSSSLKLVAPGSMFFSDDQLKSKAESITIQSIISSPLDISAFEPTLLCSTKDKKQSTLVRSWMVGTNRCSE